MKTHKLSEPEFIEFTNGRNSSNSTIPQIPVQTFEKDLKTATTERSGLVATFEKHPKTATTDNKFPQPGFMVRA